MSLDLTKLKMVRKLARKITAQCPACAERDGDSKGNHLVVYQNGKYACIANRKDKAHSKRIFELAGSRGKTIDGPVPVIVRRPAAATREPGLLAILNWLVLRSPAALQEAS